MDGGLKFMKVVMNMDGVNYNRKRVNILVKADLQIIKISQPFSIFIILSIQDFETKIFEGHDSPVIW